MYARMTMIRIEVNKSDKETTGSLVRRFSKKVRSAKIMHQAKKNRYWDRPKSEFVKKKDALKKIAKKQEYERLRKLGKISDGYFKRSKK